MTDFKIENPDGYDPSKRQYDLNDPVQRAEKFKEMLQRPELANKVMSLAANLDNLITNLKDVLSNINVGAQFKDRMSGALFEYVNIVQPYKADLVTQLVLEQAKKPLTQYMQPSFMIIREYIMQADKQIMHRHYLLSTRDFVKILALRWEIVSFGTDKGQEGVEDLRQYLESQ